MAYTPPSLDTLRERIGAALRTRFPTRAHDLDAFFGKWKQALAMAILGFLRGARDVSLDMVPNYGMSDLAADLWAYAAGVPSNDPAVKYGRNAARGAAGGQGTIIGTAGVPIPSGTQATDSTGQVLYQLSGAVTIGAGGTVTGAFVSISTGLGTNQPKGAVLFFVSPPAGVASEIKLDVAALGGGEDIETTAHLVDRILFRLQFPPRGGAAADFRRWAENYLDNNGVAPGFVARAYGYPLRGGTGTFHTLITGGGSGKTRGLSVDVQSAVGAYIDTVRPPMGQHKVLLPSMNPLNSVSVVVGVTAAATRYAFDWAAIGPYAVLSRPGATQVRINAALLGTELGTAIDAGRKPQIQLSVAAQALPVVVRALAYADVGATSTLTVEVDPGVTIAAGDSVYPGGGCVVPVAQAILALIDSLGPSRMSGFADPFDLWDDTLRLNRIIEVAQTAKDPADSTRRVVSAAAGVLINGQVFDKQAADKAPNGTPELLWATSIVVNRTP